MFFVNPVAYAPLGEPIQEYTLRRGAPATCREACYIPQAANPVARSEERYRRALAEVRAAEAEYIRAQEAVRQEAIRKERQRLLQAEVQRLERERQKALREERERQARIELLRRQLLFGEDEEEPVPVFSRVGHVHPAPVEFLAKAPRYSSAPAKFAQAPVPLPADMKGKSKAESAPRASLQTRLEEHLEEHLHKESDKDVEETLQNLLSNIFGYKVPAATIDASTASTSGTQRAPTNKPAQAPKPATAAPLKDRLEERLQKESDKDVEETLQNLLSSIFGRKVPTTTTDARAASTSGTQSAPPSAPAKTEGTNLARARALSATTTSAATTATTESTPAPAAEPSPALSAINAVARSLKALTATFVFPRTLDFTPPGSPDASDDEHEGLAYTPTNAPLRAYEHALNNLLERLDAVESEGDEEVRRRRKEVVLDVERELAEVDRRLGELRAGRGAVAAAVQADETVKEVASVAVAIEAPAAVQSYSVAVVDGLPATNEQVQSAEAPASLEAAPLAIEVDDSHNVLPTDDASVVEQTPAPAADVQELPSTDGETSPQTVSVAMAQSDAGPATSEAAAAEEAGLPASTNTGSPAESPAIVEHTDSPANENPESPVVERMEPAIPGIAENVEPQNAVSVDAPHDLDQPPSHIDVPVPAAEAVHPDIATPAPAPAPAPVPAEPACPSSSSTEAEVALPEDAVAGSGSASDSAQSSPGPEFLSALSEEQFAFPPAPVRDAGEDEGVVMVERASEEGSEREWEQVDA